MLVIHTAFFTLIHRTHYGLQQVHPVVCKYLCVVDSLQSTISAIDNGQYDEPWIRESSPCRVIMEDDNRLSIKCILVCILHKDFLFCHFDIA